MTESETKRGEARDRIPSGGGTRRAINAESKPFVAEFKPDVRLQKEVEKSCEATSRVSLTGKLSQDARYQLWCASQEPPGHDSSTKP